MFFSRIVSTVVLVSFLSAQMPRASAYEENTVYDFGESQIITHDQSGETASCPAPQSSGPTDCKNNVSPQVDALETITDQIAPEEKLPVCSKDDLGGGSLSETEVTELKQNLLNECNARFKKHKRAYAKQLLLHGRPFKALRALLKKKKKMSDIKTTTETKEIKVTGKNLTEVNEEIRVAESNAISELLGGLPEEKSSEMQKEIGNGKFFRSQYALAYKGTVSAPSIRIETPKGGGCSINVGDVKPTDPVLPSKGIMPPNDIKDGFPDDCAFMVSNTFSESQAMKMLGTNSRNSYCGKNQKIDAAERAKGDEVLGQLDAMAKQFADAAQEGLTPNFKINVTRNQYADSVVPLAQKRGEFIQKYLEMKTREELKKRGAPLPEWLKEKNGFAQVAKIEIPTYEGNTKEQFGDFGADPLAKPEEYEREKEELRITLEKKQAEYDLKITELKTFNSTNQPRVDVLSAEITTLENSVKTENALLQEQNGKKVDDLAAYQARIAEYSKMVNELATKKYEHAVLKRDIDYNTSMTTYYEGLKLKYDPVEKVKLLNEFYTTNPTPGVFNREHKEKFEGSDKEVPKKNLFNDFKMAVVEGTFDAKAGKDDEVVLGDVSPELQYMLEETVKVDNYSCSYQMSDFKKLAWQPGKKKIWKAAINTLTVGVSWIVSTPVIGLIAAGRVFKKKEKCPTWSSWHPYSKIRRAVSIKNASNGEYGKIHTKPIFYNGDNDVWPETVGMFDD